MYWLFSSSVGKKFILSISGIFLVLFLFFHMSMNLTLLFSDKIYDQICSLLGANWYAIIGTLVLFAGFFIHILYASLLTIQNRIKRGREKYASCYRTQTDWSAKNMYVLGIIVFAGLALHMYHFWFKMQFSELFHLEGAILEGSESVKALFSQPLYSIIYLFWLVALWFHLTHGVWSMFQSSGLSNKVWYPRLKVISSVVATIILIGFAVVPVYFSFQFSVFSF